MIIPCAFVWHSIQQVTDPNGHMILLETGQYSSGHYQCIDSVNNATLSTYHIIINSQDNAEYLRKCTLWWIQLIMQLSLLYCVAQFITYNLNDGHDVNNVGMAAQSINIYDDYIVNSYILQWWSVFNNAWLMIMKEVINTVALQHWAVRARHKTRAWLIAECFAVWWYKLIQ